MFTSLFFSIQLSDLDIKHNINSSSFGSLKLVSLNDNYINKSGVPTTFALKCSSKQLLAESESLHFAKQELEVLNELESPFTVRLFSHFEDYNYMYFLLENVTGQNLNNVMDELINVPEDCCRFYAASIILALEEIHSIKAAFRGLAVSLYSIKKFDYLCY